MFMKRRFIIYGLLGWCTEIVWTGFGSLLQGNLKLTAFTYIWMFPIYGMAILLEPIHDRIRHWPVVLRGGVYTLVIFFMEYSTGHLIKLLIGACPWNYGSCPYSIGGIIRLDFIPVWFVAGLLFEKVHDMLMEFTVVKRGS
ncbi:putative ABC transporter permease [Clostridium sp.]|uniref:putative ABC transporter permease n=2 Tax=Clostridium sp. TaxID=1506 RepID=UPI003DA89857